MIARGFLSGGVTGSCRNRYSRVMLSVNTVEMSPSPTIYLLNTDLEGVVEHEDDPIGLYVIMMGRNVHKVLVDQENSVNAMF